MITLDCLAAQLGGAGVPAPDGRPGPGSSFKGDAVWVPGGDEYPRGGVTEHYPARDEVCDLGVGELRVACAAIDRHQVILVCDD